jgi:DNA-binding Lrp family transcriptional regulator
LSNYNHKKLYELVKLLTKEENAIIILAATREDPLSTEEIIEKCGISPIQCHRLLRKLREIGLIKLVKSATFDGNTESEIFLYQANLKPELFRFENGRFKLRVPEKLEVSGDQVIDVRDYFKSKTKK